GRGGRPAETDPGLPWGFSANLDVARAFLPVQVWPGIPARPTTTIRSQLDRAFDDRHVNNLPLALAEDLDRHGSSGGGLRDALARGRDGIEGAVRFFVMAHDRVAPPQARFLGGGVLADQRHEHPARFADAEPALQAGRYFFQRHAQKTADDLALAEQF